MIVIIIIIIIIIITIKIIIITIGFYGAFKEILNALTIVN